MENRLQNIRVILKSQSLDAVLISSHPNLIYTTNYAGFYAEERDAYVLITKNNAYIFTHALYAEAMPSQVPHLTLVEMSRATPFTEQLQSLCKKHMIKKLGFEANDISVAEFNLINTLPTELISIDFQALRLHKLPDEVSQIKRACALTDKACNHILNLIKPGLTEKQIEHEINMFMINNKAESAFRPIVAFGKNTSVPHHLAGDTILKKNDVVLIDLGAKVDNYVADVTRTFFIGKVPSRWKELYATVLDTQQYIQKDIILKLESNLPVISSELDTLARNFITEKNYPPFPYSLGHGFGLEVHERPLLNARHHDTITDTMVFTLEPGIHLTGEIGIRIEDDFIINDNKLIKLTHSINKLINL